MLDLPIGPFVISYQLLSTTQQNMIHFAEQSKDMTVSEADYQKLLSDADAVEQHCGAMQLHVSRGAAKSVCLALRTAKNSGKLWSFGQVELGRCVTMMSQLQGCLNHEAALKVAIILPSDLAPYFTQSAPLFGADVDTKFPGLAIEIAEAGKCLALGRSTACVFHLMRTLEGALNAVHLCLALPNPRNPNWNALLTAIKTEITRRGPSLQDKDYFLSLHAQFDIIRQAWRNATMHVENVYTEQEARVLLDATEVLMRKIAGRMDESGLPLA